MGRRRRERDAVPRPYILSHYRLDGRNAVHVDESAVMKPKIDGSNNVKVCFSPTNNSEACGPEPVGWFQSSLKINVAKL